MQCSSCRFENMPGSDVCGRCGASLRIATAIIDVHPPRASQRAKRWRRATSRLNRLRESSDGAWNSLFGDLEIEGPAAGVFWRIIVPGWPQLHCGYRMRGMTMLGSYMALALSAAVFLGTSLGSVFLGLAVSVHAASVWDIVYAGTSEPRSRLLWSLLFLLLLGLAIYVPAGWFMTRLVTPLPFIDTVGPFQTGDIILSSRLPYLLSDPEPGDVVLYRIPEVQVGGFVAAGGAANFLVQGERVDRILAGPGQNVVWENRQVRIDGRESAWLPLNPERLVARFDVLVPEGHYLILPTMNPAQIATPHGDHVRRMSLVPRTNILSKVYLRNQPLSRMTVIQ